MAARKRIYYTEFRRALDAGPARPVYLFTGAENFLKEEGLRAVLDKALPSEDRKLNLEFLYAGTEVSGREVCERALTLPFFMSTRVLVVRQAEKWKPGDLEAVSEYAEQPSASTVLILSSQEERLKTAGWQRLAEKVYHVECYPLFDNQVPDWIERRARDYGKRIQREAADRLIERVGQSLSDLDNELGKLASYTGPREAITAADVLASAGRTRQDTVHELNAALGRKQAAEAVRRAEGVWDEGLAAPQILGALAWHFRQLRDGRERLDAGESLEKILGNVRLPQARRDMAEQIKAYSALDLQEVFREWLRLDEQIKSGKGHWELALVLSVLKLCAGRRAAAGA